MEEFRAVLLDVWREACRHIEITQSTETIAAMLAEHLPIAQVLVREIDAAKGCLETVAMGVASPDGPGTDARRECSAAEMEFMIAWCKMGRVVHGRRSRRAELATVVPPGVEEDVLAGPLALPDGRWAVLVLIAPAAGGLRAAAHGTGASALGAVLHRLGATTIA